MQTQISIGYEQILKLAYLLSQEEKKKLIEDLQNDIPQKGERKFGKYEGQIWMSEDFNEPLEEFSEYMP
ncbi:MAG: hypothetical protein HW421_1463 [Ignavibacteria bacterium]|nr:hypothetical protein [Ignavibacteria bacterium]